MPEGGWVDDASAVMLIMLEDWRLLGYPRQCVLVAGR